MIIIKCRTTDGYTAIIDYFSIKIAPKEKTTPIKEQMNNDYILANLHFIDM